MINEAIVLAGGLGTRLKGVIHDIPKPMAPIQDKPFLDYLLHYLAQYPIKKIVLAVGYKHEVIESAYKNSYKGIELVYAIEHEPLGTGGGIANALKFTTGQDVFLLNGDTFFKVDLTQLDQQHHDTQAQLTLSLKPMQNFDRYGTVEVSGSRITAFNEKKPLESGLINGGVYALNRSIFDQSELPQKFSFEKDIMESGVTKFNMQAYISQGYFIDIGIPTDYSRAQTELPLQVH